MKSLLLIHSAVKTGLRLLIFAVPVSWVATWSGVPTCKSAMFFGFCVFWSSVLFDARNDAPAPADPPASDPPKRIVALLTPAGVVAEARKLTRAPRHGNSNWI